ncbi:uncharacterized protein [Musca autumnalis]|uniref:uncharacterized protein n=1 Tax=Musca autumnalis TaxID=221902 RepID=UPI003CE77A2D
MAPCPKQLTYHEIFPLLLNEYFFGALIVSCLLLSIIHCVIDYYFDAIFWNITNFIVNDKILPGILGQSSWRSLKIVYLLVSFVGLNIAVQFGANIQTLFTQPPYHKYIKSNPDRRESHIKLLTDPIYGQMVLQFYGKDAISITADESEYLQHKSQFNTSYDFFIYSLVLAKNSPYLEPLSQHILRVHELGFMEAWQSSTFMDMLKLKNISLFAGYDKIVDDRKLLTVDDLFWTWMIILVGSSFGLVAFLAELCWWYIANRKKQRRLRKSNPAAITWDDNESINLTKTDSIRLRISH